MKKVVQRNNKILVLILVLSLVFLFIQYKEYKTLPRVADYTTVPADGVANLPVNWRYFAVPYENISSEEELNRHVEVKVDPEYNHKVEFIPQQEIYLRCIENDRQEIEQSAQGRFQEFIDSRYPKEDKRLTIQRIGESYRPNTTYTITVTNKPFNIFYYLLGTKTQVFTFTTSPAQDDECESRIHKFESSLSTFLATVPTKEELEKQNKYEKTCQLTQLERDYVFGRNGIPENSSIDGKYYLIENGSLKCDAVNFTGETVTVRLKDPQGKEEFEQFLKDNNVDTSKLKITYTSE